MPPTFVPAAGLLMLLCLQGAEPTSAPRVAGITTEYRHNTHADVILSRLLQTDTLDGKGRRPDLKLVSLYVDQFPKNDSSRRLAVEHRVPMFESVAESLTLGGDKLAVDGVLLVAEHGSYPKSDTGQVIYPKRRLFTEIADAFRKSGRSVPVFCDKHLADNWTDAKWLYDTAKELKAPLMAGSVLPVLWRYPPIDVPRGAKVTEFVATSFGSLDAFGFHAVEMVQCLAERRAGGETGVESVRCYQGGAVWQAGRDGVYDRDMLHACISRFKARPLPAGAKIEAMVPIPVLFHYTYRDGLKASVLILNGACSDWTVAWRCEGKADIESTVFWTQEARPFMHFAHLLNGIEEMMDSGRPTWPAERTLLTSGILDAALISKRDGGRVVKTPYLGFGYQCDWNWRQPPPPPAGRPVLSQ